jgi:hypothetical protein
MNTNKIFHFNRFARYVKSTILQNGLQTTMVWGAIATVIFLVSMTMMSRNTSHWNNQAWIKMFVILYFVAGIIYAGLSFSSFRSKKRTMGWLMLPVSAFEKFVYEFIERIVLFLVGYPIVFYLSTSFAVLVRNSTKIGKTIMVNGKQTFPFEYVFYEELITNSPEGQGGLILAGSFLIFTLAFAGAASFGKNALIKTIVFVGLIIAIVAGYFYSLFEILNLRNTWFELHLEKLSKPQGLMVMDWMFILFILTALAFSYFKLKEKEVR